MKLDLTKAHKITPHVDCFEDGEKMTYSQCIRCKCFFPIVAGDMICLSGIENHKKEVFEWTEPQTP